MFSPLHLDAKASPSFKTKIDFLLRQRFRERSRLQQCWMLKSSGGKPETGPLSQLSSISGLGHLAIHHTKRIQITVLLTDSIWRSVYYGDKTKRKSTEKWFRAVCDPLKKKTCLLSLLIAECERINMQYL